MLRVPSEPAAASIERDQPDVASLYPVAGRGHLGRPCLDHESFATHEPYGIEHYLGVEVELRVVWNLADERQGNQRLYRRVEQLTPSVARARGAVNRVLPLGVGTRQCDRSVRCHLPGQDVDSGGKGRACRLEPRPRP